MALGWGWGSAVDNTVCTGWVTLIFHIYTASGSLESAFNRLLNVCSTDPIALLTFQMRRLGAREVK